MTADCGQTTEPILTLMDIIRRGILCSFILVTINVCVGRTVFELFAKIGKNAEYLAVFLLPWRKLVPWVRAKLGCYN